MLKDLIEGDTLVVYRLDRLGRSVQHLSDLLVWLDHSGIPFCALSEGINTNTYGGKLIYHVFAAIAEFERAMILERTCAGLLAAKERGIRIGRPPILNEDAIIEAHRCIHQDGRTYAQTASKLGVSESTLQRGLRRLQMNSQPPRCRKVALGCSRS